MFFTFEGIAVSSVLLLVLLFSNAPVSRAFILQELPYYRSRSSSFSTTPSSASVTVDGDSLSSSSLTQVLENVVNVSPVEEEKPVFSVTVIESEPDSLLESIKNGVLITSETVPVSVNQRLHHKHRHHHHPIHHLQQPHHQQPSIISEQGTAVERNSRYKNSVSLCPLEEEVKQAVKAFRRRRYLCSKMLLC